MFDLLVSLGAKLNIKNKQGLTPLTLAAKLARKDVSMGLLNNCVVHWSKKCAMQHAYTQSKMHACKNNWYPLPEQCFSYILWPLFFYFESWISVITHRCMSIFWTLIVRSTGSMEMWHVLDILWRISTPSRKLVKSTPTLPCIMWSMGYVQQNLSYCQFLKLDWDRKELTKKWGKKDA